MWDRNCSRPAIFALHLMQLNQIVFVALASWVSEESDSYTLSLSLCEADEVVSLLLLESDIRDRVLRGNRDARGLTSGFGTRTFGVPPLFDRSDGVGINLLFGWLVFLPVSGLYFSSYSSSSIGENERESSTTSSSRMTSWSQTGASTGSSSVADLIGGGDLGITATRCKITSETYTPCLDN